MLFILRMMRNRQMRCAANYRLAECSLGFIRTVVTSGLENIKGKYKDSHKPQRLTER